MAYKYLVKSLLLNFYQQSLKIITFNSNSVELFEEYVTPKDNANSPKQFTDCAKLYSECRAPNEQPIGAVNKRKKPIKNKNKTSTQPLVEETTPEIDPVTQYVQQKRK